MSTWWDLAINYLNPETLLQQGGFWVIVLIVFLESGLFFFFLPGDSLLFLSGLFCSAGWLPESIWLLIFALMSAGILGYFISYYLGRKLSFVILSGKDYFFLKRKYILKTQAYYEKNHKVSLIFGRFVPVIRTFVPLLAGACRINFKDFALYNVIGSALWIVSLTLGGYFLGNIPFVKEYLEFVILLMAILPFVPLIISFFKKKKIAIVKNEIKMPV